MSDRSVVIVSGARTPIGSFNGALSSLKASELGAVVIKESLKRANLKGEDVNEVIFGQALCAGAGQNPCRQAAFQAGLPESVPAFTINMLCGSGLKSVFLGYQSILSGVNDVVVCGGQESMSQSPHTIHLRSGVKMGNAAMQDTMLHDGLTDAFHNIHMGNTAENIRKKYSITRVEQDEYAAKSQNKVEAAQNNGYFNAEIVPVEVKSFKSTNVVSVDEYPKHGTTVESLSKLRPAFEKEGTVTAGNASGVNDGAASVVLMEAKTAAEKGIKSLAVIKGIAQSGMDPLIMGMGPVPAVKSLLAKVGWSADEVDLYELNEAFAAQAIGVVRELNLDEAKVNISGGAIALGHPIAASGCRVLVTLLYALERTNKSKGVAALCIGGGMGVAIAIERL